MTVSARISRSIAGQYQYQNLEFCPTLHHYLLICSTVKLQILSPSVDWSRRDDGRLPLHYLPAIHSLFMSDSDFPYSLYLHPPPGFLPQGLATAIYGACGLGSLAIVSALLKAGADVNAYYYVGCDVHV